MSQRSLVVVFTDIVVSTSHRVARGDAVADQVRRDHDALVRAAVEQHGGVWVKSTGDGALVTFTSATAALEAGAMVVREVASSAGEHAFEVRVGATAGEVAIEDDGDVFGTPVNTAARICDAAHPNQFLVSDEVVRLAGSRALLEVVPLGALELKGLGTPVNAHAVRWGEGAPVDLKASVARVGSSAGSIPESVTSFVGRRAELAELREVVKQHRLVTILGPGGMGKTRLSIALAVDLRDQFPDGVWFVDLSVLVDERAVSTLVLKTLGVADTDEGSGEQLARYLTDRRALLVIDNCEHLIQSAAEVVHRIVAAATGVRVVTTSRERLGVPSEYIWNVPAIGTADDNDDGIELFVQRAESAGARLSEADRDDVVALCRLLDGMPLAIELASARCRSVSPGRVLERLRQRPDQALGSSRTGPERQRSLDGLVSWSVDLLDDRERRLFTSLAVFEGAFPVEAAEQVCSDEDIDEFDVIDLLSALVDKSLVATTRGHDGRLWYRLLFTIRAHADELLESARCAELQRRLLGWLTSHVEELERDLRGPGQVAAHWELTDVHPLLIGALQRTDDGLDDLRRDLADSVSYWFWFAGHHREAIALVAALVEDGDPATRARLHAWQALHARALGREETTHIEAAQALVDAHDCDDVTRLRVASARDPFDVARSRAEVARAIETGRDDLAVDFHLRLLTAMRTSAGADPGEEWRLALAAATTTARRLGDPKSWSDVENMTAWEATLTHRPLEAVTLYEAAVVAARACPIEAYVVKACIALAGARQRLPDEASRLLAIEEARGALDDARRLDLPHLLLSGSGVLALTLGNVERFEEAVEVVEAHPTEGFDQRDRFMSNLYHWVGRHEDAVATLRRWLAAEEVGDMHLMWPAPYAMWSLGAIADAVALARCSSVALAFYVDSFDQMMLARLVEQGQDRLAPDEWAVSVERGEAMTLAEGAALTRRLLAANA